MIGKPKYKLGETVKFKIGEDTYEGDIYIIDKYGTFEDDSDVSYDIMVHNHKHKSTKVNFETGKREVVESIGDCLFKHINEKLIV